MSVDSKGEVTPMGVDMSAIRPRAEVPAGFDPEEWRWRGDTPWGFTLNWSGMGKMLEEMDRADVLDIDTPKPEWPKWPGEEHFEERDEISELGSWHRPLDPLGEFYEDAVGKIRTRLGEHGKVPAFKFESNDFWIVTAPECLWIADALDQRVLLLDECRWTDLVEAFAKFNRRCAEGASGYYVA